MDYSPCVGKLLTVLATKISALATHIEALFLSASAPEVLPRGLLWVRPGRQREWILRLVKAMVLSL